MYIIVTRSRVADDRILSLLVDLMLERDSFLSLMVNKLCRFGPVPTSPTSPTILQSLRMYSIMLSFCSSVTSFPDLQGTLRS